MIDGWAEKERRKWRKKKIKDVDRDLDRCMNRYIKVDTLTYSLAIDKLMIKERKLRKKVREKDR